MARIVSESLMVSAPNAPLDKRTEVDSLSQIGSIENPSPSLIIYDKETKKHYSIKEMADEMIPGTSITHKVIKSVEPIGSGSVDYEELGSVDLDGIIDQTDVSYTEIGDAPVVDFEKLS